MRQPPVVRWTIGDVSQAGFEALRLSIAGAHRLFGGEAGYVVCVNSVGCAQARRRTGSVPADVEWRPVTKDDLPAFIRPHLDGALAEGVGWKFAPFRVSRERPELALDNDCILWDLPDAVRQWLSDERGDTRVIAEDVRPCFGQFAALCGDQARNAGIRGLPAGFDLERRMRAALAQTTVVLRSELDEQGLQVAAVSMDGEPSVVRLAEVTICSPFPPHLPHLGRCGAHFVGVNARSLPWSYEGRPAVAYIQEHWVRWREEVARRVHGGLQGRLGGRPRP